MFDARCLAFTLCCLLVFAAVAPGLGASDSLTSPEQPTVDNTVTHIQIQASGNATWSVAVRTRLETEAEVEQYRAFQERFRNNTSRYLDTFRGRIGPVVADAERVTGREMRGTNFSASTHVQEVPRRWGVITYQFRWTNFAAKPTETTLSVGDVFQGGYYLDENDIFAVSGPDGYTLQTASPAPDERGSRMVRWFGPRDFGDERPRAVFRTDESNGESNGTTSSTSGSDGTTTAEPAADSGRTPVALIGGVVLVTLGLGAAAVWRTRSSADELPPEDDASGASTTGPTPDSTASVKTDAEQVETLLRERGGRMKQAEMADALDWSASKTSRVLSDLEDDGVVERVRLGRENVVDLSESTDE